MGKRVDEDWSDEDLDRLLDVARTQFDESIRSHEAGLRLAALIMLGGALEAELLAMIVVHQEAWRSESYWPDALSERGVSKLHLRELVDAAWKEDWLSAEVVDRIDVLVKARDMAAHPGAHVRALRQMPDYVLGDEVGYPVVFDIFVAAFAETAAAMKKLRAGP